MDSLKKPEKKGITLLIVDDDDVDREKIRRMLNSAEIEAHIDESSSLSGTLDFLCQKDYDCVIVDYRLGVDDGLEVLNSIRNNLHKKCAVIIVTGLGDEKIAAEALRLGANDYLIKNQLKTPVLLKSVLEAVHKTEMDRKIHELAHFDRLTGLVSRHLLIDRLQQAIAYVGRKNKTAALAFIDLDNFKPVNDLYGHESGDEVLIEISSRLSNAVRLTDTVSRIGGDEFVILLPEVSSASECEDLLRRILLILGVPILLSNQCSVRVSASVGVAMINEADLDADTVLRRADQTMYQAKNSGKNKFLFFDPEEEIKQSQRRHLLSEVEEGLKNNEFTLYFQPKVNLSTGELAGLESLIRWNHPERGILLPIHFKDALFHSKIGAKVGEWVIEEAIKQYLEWKKLGWDLGISVNISPSHIHNYDFIDRLDRILNKYPECTNISFLEFEVLESVSIKDVSHFSKVLDQCRERGIKIALDDFGTGYASLTYLKLLPLDTLKLDQSFIRNIQSDSDNIAIVKSTVALAEAFQYALVAEGIENTTQANTLVELGCDCIQGYLVSEPISGEKIINWLKSSPDYTNLGFQLKVSNTHCK